MFRLFRVIENRDKGKEKRAFIPANRILSQLKIRTACRRWDSFEGQRGGCVSRSHLRAGKPGPLPREGPPACRNILPVIDTVANGAILPVDNHIRPVFSGKLFCLPDRSILVPVFGSDAFIPLSPNGPPLLIGHHMLVPGLSPVGLTRAFKEELRKLAYYIDPGSGFAGFWHLAFFEKP